MTVSEILEELPRLDADARRTIMDRLQDIESAEDEAERAEELAAIDEGIRSLETEPTITLEELRKRLDEWTTKLS